CSTDEALLETVRLLRDELDQPALCAKVARTLTRARVRGRKFIAATDPALIGARKAVATVSVELSSLVSNVDKRIGELQKSSDAAQRKLQENELRGLEDRVWLKTIQSDVEAEIERLKRVAAFGLAIQDADTNRITRKTTELSKTLVTNTIRDAFASETVSLSIA